MIRNVTRHRVEKVRRQTGNQAFTLVEATAVVAVIGALAILLAPAPRRLREKSQRALCREHLRTLGVAAHIYAGSHSGALFAHRRSNGDWVGFNLPATVVAQITDLAGEKSIDCPNLQPFTMPGQVYTPGSRQTANEGAVIGYIYCGGIDETDMLRRFGWLSPSCTSADPTSPIFTDLNASGWDHGYWAIAPHTPTGPSRIAGKTYLLLQAKITPRDLNMEGGNICLLDGSVQWKPVERMQGDYSIYKYDFGARGIW